MKDLQMGMNRLVPVRILVPVSLVAALAGCGSFGAIGLPWQKAQAPAANLDPAGLPPVESSDLPPPTDGQQQANAYPTPDAGAEAPLAQPQAAAPTGASGGELGRTDLLGGWTITSSGDSCQLFMTLTSWTGGYRASTRGCSSDVLKSISAWNLQGTQVVLAGQGGTPVAHLSPAGSNRFDGQTGQGSAVTFFR
jgi:hypothetical protein